MTDEFSASRIYSPKISEVTYQILKEKIASKELAPGVRLNLDVIEKQLGISRTPIKQALDRLAMEGLVSIKPRSGTFISNPSPEEIIASFEVRRALELYAIEVAAKNATRSMLNKLRILVQELRRLTTASDLDTAYPRYLTLDHQFHHQLIEIANNDRLLQAFERENVHAQMARIRYHHPEGEINIAQSEHERILAAIEAHDSQAARAEMDAHLERACRSLMADLREMSKG